CWNRRMRCCAGPRRICRSRTCREKALPARERARRRRDSRGGDVPGSQARPPALLPLAERTAWRICSNNGWWSVFGKRKRGKNGKVGPPVHDDLVGRDFTADAPNRLWLADI